MPDGSTRTREDAVEECRRLKAAMQKTKSEKLRVDYGKKLRRLQKRLLYM
jgi:hypothetical protein